MENGCLFLLCLPGPGLTLPVCHACLRSLGESSLRQGHGPHALVGKTSSESGPRESEGDSAVLLGPKPSQQREATEL